MSIAALEAIFADYARDGSGKSKTSPGTSRGVSEETKRVIDVALLHNGVFTAEEIAAARGVNARTVYKWADKVAARTDPMATEFKRLVCKRHKATAETN